MNGGKLRKMRKFVALAFASVYVAFALCGEYVHRLGDHLGLHHHHHLSCLGEALGHDAHESRAPARALSSPEKDCFLGAALTSLSHAPQSLGPAPIARGLSENLAGQLRLQPLPRLLTRENEPRSSRGPPAVSA